MARNIYLINATKEQRNFAGCDHPDVVGSLMEFLLSGKWNISDDIYSIDEFEGPEKDMDEQELKIRDFADVFTEQQLLMISTCDTETERP